MKTNYKGNQITFRSVDELKTIMREIDEKLKLQKETEKETEKEKETITAQEENLNEVIEPIIDDEVNLDLVADNVIKRIKDTIKNLEDEKTSLKNDKANETPTKKKRSRKVRRR